MKLSAISLAITAMFGGRSSPADLFASGEQGAWYDPSDRATLFQDSAGTTPVTAVEQPVGLILDKSKGLVLGPELVTNWDFSADASWAKGTGWVISGGVASKTTADNTSIGQVIATIPGATYQVVFSVTTPSLSSGVRVFAGDLTSGFFNALGTYSVVFRASASSTTVNFNGGSFSGGSIDNISVRELPGNHAFQATTTSRPVLSARYNLFERTEEFENPYWLKTNSTVTQNAVVAPDGTVTADKLVETTAAGTHDVYRSGVGSAAALVFSVCMKSAERTWGVVRIDGASTFFDLANGTVGTSAAGNSGSITPLGGGWFRCTVARTLSGSTFAVIRAATGNNADSYTGDGTSGIYIWGASLTPANQASLPYQRVNTSTDYDADPAKFPVYLRFDGVDDWLQTNSIDFTATDKMTVFAGVRKLSDAARGIVAELGNGGLVTNQWVLNAPTSNTPGYSFTSSGTLAGFADVSTGYPSPTTNVLIGLGDISGDSAILRVNGTQVASSTANQGTGNYRNDILYIGRRGGTTFTFNGQLYSLIVRGAQTSGTQIAQTERWVAGKTGVTL